MTLDDPPLLLDSITKADARSAGCVVVCGSHGGLYAARLAAKARVRAVLLNDAGIGLDGAGVAGILALAGAGVPAAAVDHDSARIGDAADALARGRVSTVNEAAAALGVSPGQAVAEAARLLAAAPDPAPEPWRAFPAIAEAREEVPLGEARIVLVDSVSLVRPEDAGRIVVTGSHGGLVGGVPATAVSADVAVAVYNDAGLGVDDSGVTRLPALEGRGIAGATVGHDTARIGDARSALETGIVSAANPRAAALGIVVGRPLREALAAAAERLRARP